MLHTIVRALQGGVVAWQAWHAGLAGLWLCEGRLAASDWLAWLRAMAADVCRRQAMFAEWPSKQRRLSTVARSAARTRGAIVRAGSGLGRGGQWSSLLPREGPLRAAHAVHLTVDTRVISGRPRRLQPHDVIDAYVRPPSHARRLKRLAVFVAVA